MPIPSSFKKFKQFGSVIFLFGGGRDRRRKWWNYLIPFPDISILIFNKQCIQHLTFKFLQLYSLRLFPWWFWYINFSEWGDMLCLQLTLGDFIPLQQLSSPKVCFYIYLSFLSYFSVKFDCDLHRNSCISCCSIILNSVCFFLFFH